jgi:dopamine beta-monooxygenase
MKGSDIFLFAAAKPLQVVDSYVLDENVMPLPDDCQSWQLVQSFVGDEFLIVEVTRLLDTQDPQDRALTSDAEVFQYATRVIGAWGDSATPTFHGKQLAKGSLRFFGSSANNTGSLAESFRADMDRDASGSFFVGASNYSVPVNETTYVNFCVKYKNLLAQAVLSSQDVKKHIIGIEPFIDPRAVKHVHHFLVYGSVNPGDDLDCQDASANELIYLWAPGGLSSQPPPMVGIPLGGSGGYLSFSIEVHYDNPEFVAGIIDSSGVKLYYTPTVRQYDQGVLSLGDPRVDVQPVVLSVAGGLTQHSFFCPANCTQNYFGQEVTVYAEALHMHQNGKAMQNQHIRDGAVIRRGVSQYYDFEQQGGYEVIQAPFQLKPGDAFNVICTYDADPGERWGLASSDEMCISFLFYYPRQLIPFEGASGPDQIQPLCGIGLEGFLPGCESIHQVTPDYTRFALEDREFGRSGGMCAVVDNNNNGDKEGSDNVKVSGTFARLYFPALSLVLLLIVALVEI